MRTDLFSYDLPEENIAQEPKPRGESRLLVADAVGAARHRRVSDLPSLLEPGDLVVTNNTRVIPARIFGTTQTGGRIELLLVEKISPASWLAMARPGKKATPGRILTFSGGLSATARERVGDLYRFDFSEPIEQALETIGHMPLPPYIRRPEVSADKETYQTVFATRPGAVAAPTAGLHFSNSMLDEIDKRGIRRVEVTLHVGLGTFKTVSAESVADHEMHSERFSIPQATCDAITRTKA